LMSDLQMKFFKGEYYSTEEKNTSSPTSFFRWDCYESSSGKDVVLPKPMTPAAANV
jgi:hypothetical protein